MVIELTGLIDKFVMEVRVAAKTHIFFRLLIAALVTAVLRRVLGCWSVTLSSTIDTASPRPTYFALPSKVALAVALKNHMVKYV